MHAATLLLAFSALAFGQLICSDSLLACTTDADCTASCSNLTFSCRFDSYSDPCTTNGCPIGWSCNDTAIPPVCEQGCASGLCGTGYCVNVTGAVNVTCLDDSECNDGNQCTVDVCVISYGCVSSNLVNGSVCDDDDECTGPDTCDGYGVCSGNISTTCTEFRSPGYNTAVVFMTIAFVLAMIISISCIVPAIIRRRRKKFESL